MAAYEVSYKFRDDIAGLSPTEAEAVTPAVDRVAASDATRAISGLINGLKAGSVIGSKSDIKVLEVKVVA